MVQIDSHASSTSNAIGERVPVVRIRARCHDPFNGLKGHDYIKARNLAPPVQRVQTSAHAGLPDEMLERK